MKLLYTKIKVNRYKYMLNDNDNIHEIKAHDMDKQDLNSEMLCLLHLN